jgi:carbonic anhydrase
MNRRTLLLGFGLLGATALSGGGTVYALNTLGLVPKPTSPPEPGQEAAAKAGHGAATSTTGNGHAAAGGPAATPGSGHAAGGPAATPGSGHAAAAGDAPHWGYEGPTGPAGWGDLEPANALCKLGGAQSPIDLARPLRVAALSGLQPSYGSTRVKVTNNGHTFQVNVDKGSSLKVEGTKFDLLQFHFHTPSEHTVDGKTFPLELHLVHQAADKSLAVIGVLMTEGTSNVVLGRFWDKMPKAVGEVDTGVTIELKDLLPRLTDDYHTYAGSLTTPPCSESVRWIVLEQPVQVSKAQIAAFRTVFPMNARPTMPLGARYLLSS